jgi:acyl dehydratase
MCKVIPFEHLADHIHEELPPSAWHLITQDTVNAFSQLTGDRQWIHIDPIRAKKDSPYQSTIAHGYLILAYTPALLDGVYLISGASMGINRGCNRLRFIHPLKTGDSMRLSAQLTDVKPLDESVDTFWDLNFRDRDTRNWCARLN